MPHVHNALHHAAQLQDAYRKAVGEPDASFSGVERAGETLTPTLDLWARPEWAWLRREIWYARFVISAAVAARFSSIELVNPAGSGVIAVVRRLYNAVDTELQIDFGTALGVTATTQGVAIDSRAPIGAASKSTVVTGDLAAGTSLPQWRLTADEVTLDIPPYVLTPGSKLFIMGVAVNTAVRASLLWSERAPLPGELG